MEEALVFQLPAYLRIEHDIRRQIDAGLLKVGDRIPTEEELSARYGVARMTVRQGLSRLVASGLLVRRQGVGTFVAAPKIERVGQRLLGFEEDTRAHGLQPSTEVLARGWVTPAPEDARVLELPAGGQVFQVERRRWADGVPIGLNTVVLPAEMGRRFEHRAFDGSFYALVEDVLGQPVAYADQRVEATNADGRQAEALGIAVGAALLKIERVTYLRDGQRLGLTRTYYRGDRYFVALRVER